MKRILIVMLIVFISSCANSKNDTKASTKESNSNLSHSIKWYNIEEGLKAVKKHEKPAIVDFYADWCVWCKKLEENVFNKPVISQYLSENFIMIRLDTESNDPVNYKGNNMSPQELSSYFGVTGLPTLLFLDKKGEPVTKLPGYIEPDTFFSLIKYMNAECYNKKVDFNDYKKGKIKCD